MHSDEYDRKSAEDLQSPDALMGIDETDVQLATLWSRQHRGILFHAATRCVTWHDFGRPSASARSAGLRSAEPGTPTKRDVDCSSEWKSGTAEEEFACTSSG